MLSSLRARARFDLHLHTLRSDGRYSVSEVLRRCAEGGLEAVALTDHDLGSDFATGEQTVAGRRLLVIAGAEISATHDGAEYHLLVYFPGAVPDGFQRFCQNQCRERAARYAAAVQMLDLPDLPPPDEVATRGDRALTRLHLARALVEHGHAKNIRDAFARYLGSSHETVPSFQLQFVDAIRAARSFGGLTSWAHPPMPAVRKHLHTFVAAGLQGIEGLRPHLDSRQRRFYRDMARRYGLYLTGGSDWHGWGEPDLGLFSIQKRELADFIDTLQAA